MDKLAILRLDGDLEQGVRGMLTITSQQPHSSIEINGSLPPNANLAATVQQWQLHYRSLSSTRIQPNKITYNVSIQQQRLHCHKLAQSLRSQLNHWLLSESFRPVRDGWLEHLMQDEVRVLIRTANSSLLKLPWYLWELVERNPRAEVALSIPDSQANVVSETPRLREQVRILAILGDSTGIDVQHDQRLLDTLVDAETKFLVEPQRQEINRYLWEHTWDILFFAGHSCTEKEQGRIYINQTDSLTIAELRYALQTAVERGLQLAIFNSCDGMGLAFELQQLQIPQTIVMREPVPDQVAQAFLTHLLPTYAQGQSLYLAVREARLRLQGLENEFPGASWLPVIFQNPAISPPLWQDLGRRPTNVCPYRGLFAFREEDTAFFYGRDAFTQMLVEAVQQQFLVAVIGPSGSGKSSVVFAGLIPQLRSERTWLIEAFRPGDRPFRNLAAKLVPLLETHRSETDQLLEINKQTKALQQGDLALRDVIACILEKNPGDRFLLVVDQFEELYTLCRDARERLLFLDSLLEAVKYTPNFTLVLTLRADFLGQALSYRPFGDALQYADLKLSPMNREELQAAVEQPAAMLGVAIESGLTQRILDAVSTQPGDLPLLEFALNQLWAKQRDAQLTHAAYEEIGGVEAALSRYAEEAYGRLNEEEKERARRIFIQLVRPGEGTEDTRRLATCTEVGEENWDLVTRLADARLVVSSRDEALGEETVEIVHEALIGGWFSLRLWIELDRAFRIWQERLRASLRQWEATGKDEGALLRGVPLAEAEGWLASRAVELSPAERVFIQISLDLRDRDRKEQLRLRKRTIFGLAGSLAVVSILAGGTFWQWQQAEIRQNQAEQSAKIAFSNQLVAQAQTQLDQQPDLALLLSVEANRIAKTIDAQSFLLTALQYRPFTSFLHGHTSDVNSVAFSPNGKILASASGTQTRDDNTVRLWNISTRQSLGKPLKGHTAPVKSVAFSPDGQILASGSIDRTIILWDVATGLPIGPPLKGHDDPVHTLTFSPDGQTLASGSCGGRDSEGTCDQGEIRLWNVATRKPLGQPLMEHTSAVYDLAFSPDGKILASGSGGAIYFGSDSDYTIRLWDVATRKPLRQLLKGHKAGVNTLAFSPDSKTLASGSADTTVILWDITTGKPRQQALEGDKSTVIKVAFSRDGKELIMGTSDNTVIIASKVDFFYPTVVNRGGFKLHSLTFNPDTSLWAGGSCSKRASNGLCTQGSVSLWSISTPSSISQPITGSSNSVNGVAFSPNGKILASGGCGVEFSPCKEGGEVQLWDRATRQPIGQPLKGLQDEVESLTFSPDGKTLAAGSCGNTGQGCQQGGIYLWDAFTHKALGSPLAGHTNTISILVFSSDSKTLISSDKDTIILWDVTSRQPLVKPIKFHSNVVASIALSPDGKTLAIGSCGKKGERSGAYEWSENGCLQGEILLWDVTTRQLLGQPLKAHTDQVTSVAFSPDGKILASASGNFDGTISLWDVSTRKAIGPPLQGHTSGVEQVTFSPDGKTLASMSDIFDMESNSIFLWDVVTRRKIGVLLAGHTKYVQNVAFSPDGKTLASGNLNNKIILWDIYPASWINKACSIANRNLTPEEWEQFMKDSPGDRSYRATCPSFPMDINLSSNTSATP
ncbi:MAG: CHAT domain-containing protein [Trichocoleus desertorum ATA4-8-CV12]|nr:CHAT domain-containing protein [Trichocoleus desertorum ATA4-8-CV12]